MAKRAPKRKAGPRDFARLRSEVKAWYRAEAERLAADFAGGCEVGALDFAELVRRSQALLACEMIELVESQGEAAEPELEAADYAQLERVAKAMAAQGKEVPEAIAAALETGRSGHS